MSRTPRLTIVLLTLFSAVVAGIDLVGHTRWGMAVRSLEREPVRGVETLSSDPWLGVPAAVHLSRRLLPRELSTASTRSLAVALEKLARRQQRWMWTHPQGFATSSRAALLAGEVDAGLDALGQALVRDPNSARLHRAMALALRAIGRDQDCLDHLAEAWAIWPGTPAMTLGLTRQEVDRVRLEGLERRMERYPRQRISTLLDYARALKQRGRAGEGLARLTELAPEPRVAIEISRWEIEGGELESASRRLEAVSGRRAYPSSLRAAAWALLAEARDLQGDDAGAAEAARQALVLAPESAAPYLALAILAERRGDLETALNHLRRAWGIAPTDVGLLVRIASTAERADKLADARLALERAVELQPGSAGLAARLVEFHLRNGQYMEAALRLSRSLDRFPTDDQLLGLAERLRREVGRVGE
jgi:Tfp pilus assembly protein PilF